MPPLSAAMALRESFGDRKLPEISRKITACVPCRKLKIKCHMDDRKPPCSRCKARGTVCTVNKSLQALLENDASWKETMEERVEKLEQMLKNGANQPSSITSADADHSRLSQVSHGGIETDSPGHPSFFWTAENSNPFTLNLSCGLGAFPASSMISWALTDLEPYPGRSPDMISNRLVPLEVAESLFAFYRQCLDPYVHYILTERDTLTTIRARSSLLTAAICTAAAFCTGSRYYRSLLNSFTNEVSRKIFSVHYAFDDVRALCVGAYWLNEVSPALNGLAVRIATQLELHRCLTKMPHAKRECYERTRLYMLVYLCDHHCSLSHGRPPLTRDFPSRKSPRDFAKCDFSSPCDLALISQVELWSISSRVFDVFGADIESGVTGQRSADLSRLNGAYEQWYHEWHRVLSLKEESDTFSQRVFDLYFHSAKLYLLSHVFRGPSREDVDLSANAADHGDDFAHRALTSAVSIVCCIVREPQSRLEKLPSYIGIMTAFASVCLVKASSQGKQIACTAETDDIPGHLRRLVGVLLSSPMVDHQSHPLRGIAESLRMVTATPQRPSDPECGRSERGGDLCFDFALDDFDMFINDPANVPSFRGGEGGCVS